MVKQTLVSTTSVNVGSLDESTTDRNCSGSKLTLFLCVCSALLPRSRWDSSHHPPSSLAPPMCSGATPPSPSSLSSPLSGIDSSCHSGLSRSGFAFTTPNHINFLRLENCSTHLFLVIVSTWLFPLLWDCVPFFFFFVSFVLSLSYFVLSSN